MLRPDQKAAGQMAWQNFTRNQPEKAAQMNLDEDGYLAIIEQLEKSYRSGLMERGTYDQRLTTLFRQPELALEVVTFVAPKRSTAQLYKELKDLHRKGILDDDEFQERKEDLAFERPDFIDPEAPVIPGEGGAIDRDRLKGYLDELLKAGALDDATVQQAKTKLDQLYSPQA